VTIVNLPRLAVAILALLALALAGSGCGSDDEGGGGETADAKALLERAFDKSADSGDLFLEVKADVDGVRSVKGPLALRLSGPFKSNGPKRLPLLDWDITFNGAGQRLAGGVIATETNAYLLFQQQAFELGEDTFGRLAQRLSASKRERPLTPGGLGIDPAAWLKDAEVEDGDSIGGDSTRKITGSVDVGKALRDLVDAIDSPDLRRRLERQGQPALPKPREEDLRKIEDAVRDVDVEMNVDRNDVLRRFFAEVDFDAEGGDDGKDAKGKLSFSYVLRKVGGNPVIRAPGGARPLRELLGGLAPLLGSGGLNP
jgi:hypothetical protein